MLYAMKRYYCKVLERGTAFVVKTTFNPLLDRSDSVKKNVGALQYSFFYPAKDACLLLPDFKYRTNRLRYIILI